MYLFFSFSFRYIISCTLVLWPFSESKHYIYFWYIYIYMMMMMMMMMLSIHLSLHVLFLLSLYTHVSYYCMQSFKNTGCQNLSCHELFSCKVFQEFMLGLDFIVFNKWLWVEWFMTFLIFHLFVVILSWIAKGGDYLLWTYVI